MRNYFIIKFLLKLSLFITYLIESRNDNSRYVINYVNTGDFTANFFLFNNCHRNHSFYLYILDIVLFHLNKIYKEYGDIYLYAIVFEVNNPKLPVLLSQPYIFKFNNDSNLSAKDLFDKLEFNNFNGNKANICVMVRLLHQPSIQLVKINNNNSPLYFVLILKQPSYR